MPQILENQIALKGGEFLIKDSNPEEIFIPEELTEEQLMIKQMAKDFVDTEIFTRLDAIDDHEPGLVPSLMEKCGELGLLGISIPEEYGGFAKDFNTGTAVTEIVGAAHSFSVAFSAHTGIGTLPILYFGSEQLKSKYLPGLTSGKLKASYCLTEPGSGSDALGAKTKAVLTDDKKHYVLNGQKIFITNAGFADVFIVFAKIDGKDFTGFVVDRDTEGLTVGEEEKKMGIKGSSTCPVFLDNAKVPVENVLGEIGKGHLIAFNILNIGRYKLCAAAVGSQKRISINAVKYANERNQFNIRISKFGAIKYKLSEMVVKTFASESALYRVGGYIDKMIRENVEHGTPKEKAVLIAAEEYAIECAMLKVLGSEYLDYVVDETVQIYGGYGFIEEYPAARAYRDARINRIFEGTNEINRLLTVDMLLKKAMKGKLDLMTPAMNVQKELMSIPDFGNEEEGLFIGEEKTVKNLKKAILMVAGAAVQKLMMTLEKEQEILMNVADMMIDLFIAESILLRIKKLAGRKGITASDQLDGFIYNDILKVFFTDCVDRVNKAGKTAITSFSEGDEMRMMLLGLKRFTKYETTNTKDARRRIADMFIAAEDYCF
ncbi:MAG: acyl-CoA dehydrogenase family protein [Chitinophagales bacterium]